MANVSSVERKVEVAERLIAQGYLKRTAEGVVPTKRGKRALESFTGGPLARDSFDLDSAYYGSVQANRRREIEWAEKFLSAWVRSLAHPLPDVDIWANADDQAILDGRRPKSESTVYWMRYFHEIDEPSLERLYLGGWEGVACWKLDVHRAITELAKKTSKTRLLIFALYAEGWDRDEIGQLLRSMSPGEEWSSFTVNDRIKEISRSVRRRTEVHTPKAGFTDEVIAPTSLAHRAEETIAWARRLNKKRARGTYRSGMKDI